MLRPNVRMVDKLSEGRVFVVGGELIPIVFSGKSFEHHVSASIRCCAHPQSYRRTGTLAYPIEFILSMAYTYRWFRVSIPVLRIRYAILLTVLIETSFLTFVSR